MRHYLLDTHVLLWLLGGQASKLGRAASRAAESAWSGSAELVVSVVTLWEVALLHDEGHLRLPVSFSAWCDALEAMPGLTVTPLVRGDIEEARALAMLRDPHDRLIAGTAMRLGFPLITADQRIRRSGVRIVWDR